jgi:hypothetical protein
MGISPKNRREEVNHIPETFGMKIAQFIEARGFGCDTTFYLVHRLAYNGDVVAFKMGRRQGGPSRTGGKRAHI